MSVPGVEAFISATVVEFDSRLLEQRRSRKNGERSNEHSPGGLTVAATALKTASRAVRNSSQIVGLGKLQLLANSH